MHQMLAQRTSLECLQIYQVQCKHGYLSTDAKFCPNWEAHAEPRTKWIHPSFRKQSNHQDQSAARTPGGNQGTDPKDDQLAAARQALKQV